MELQLVIQDENGGGVAATLLSCNMLLVVMIMVVIMVVIVLVLLVVLVIVLCHQISSAPYHHQINQIPGYENNISDTCNLQDCTFVDADDTEAVVDNLLVKNHNIFGNQIFNFQFLCQ